MGRRGQDCRCCGCNSCDKKPAILIAHIEYPSGSGEIIAAQKDGNWSAVTTTCGIEPERVNIARLRITDPGEGYTTPPAITLAGGGGTQTGYAATIQSPIISIQITNAGSGYTTAPTVTISTPGGGGTITKASAQAFIENGSVSKIELVNRGLYRNTKTDFGVASFPDWPTVTLSGNATAVPVFAGKLIAASAGGSGYASAPTVTFTGGGGTGAAATAELLWERTHDRTAEFTDRCFAFVSLDGPFTVVCLDAASDKFPPPGATPCFETAAEAVGWDVVAVNRNDVFVFADFIGGTNQFLFFPGEAVFARVRQYWQVKGVDLGEPQMEVRQERETYYVQRFYSRVPPDVFYELADPSQDDDDNVRLTPTWTQYVDEKEDSFWYLESLAIASAGTNLRIPVNPVYVTLSANGNSRHRVEFATATFNRTAPVLKPLALAGFDVQPQLSATIIPSGSAGLHQLTAVGVTAGGQTDREDGQIEINLELQVGHFDGVNGRATLTGTIEGGQLASVAIAQASLILGPATLASVTLPEDPFFDNLSRRAVGESPFVVTRQHAQPTVTATHTSGNTTLTLTVTLSQETDANGDIYWRVSNLSGPAIPEGFNAADAIVFEATAPAIEAVPAVAISWFEEGTANFVGYRIASGGKYYIRTITATTEPLPPISCLGEVNAENGWEINQRELILAFITSYAVGQSFTTEYQAIPAGGGPSFFPELDRTRRCDLPAITVELQ